MQSGVCVLICLSRVQERLIFNLALTGLTFQCARALQYLHSKGMVHRDLKGSNVLLDLQGNAVLSDMGTAFIAGRAGKKENDETMRLMATMQQMDTTGMLGESATMLMKTMVGSIPWMAPEVLTAEGWDRA